MTLTFYKSPPFTFPAGIGRLNGSISLEQGWSGAGGAEPHLLSTNSMKRHTKVLWQVFITNWYLYIYTVNKK